MRPLFIFFFLSLNLSLEAAGLRLTPAKESPLDVELGQIAVYCVVVENTNPEPALFEIHLSLPPGWETVTEETSPFQLESGHSLPLILALRVPSSATPGEHFLSLALRSPQSELLGRLSFSCKVASHKKLKAFWENLPLFLTPGSLHTLTLCLVNEGNCPMTLFPEMRADPPDCQLVFPQEPWSVLPNERLAIPLELSIPWDLGGQFDQFLSVRLLDSQDVAFQQTIKIEIIPCGTIEANPYVVLPAALRVFAAHNNEQDMAGVELSGAGCLYAPRHTLVDFFFRVPSDRMNPLYGEEERLFLGLSEPEGDLVLGDTVYALSPLILRGRYGRGVGIDLYRSRWEAGSYYVQEVVERDAPLREEGVYLSTKLLPETWLSLQYARRHVPLIQIEVDNGQPNPYVEADLASLSLDFAWNECASGVIEVGKDFGTYCGKRGGYGYFLGCKGTAFFDTDYYLENAYATRQFHGDYRDVSMLTCGFDAPLTKPLRLTGSYYENRQGVEVREASTPFHSTIYQRQTEAIFNYACGASSNLSFRALDLRAYDIPECGTYDFWEHWVGANWGFASPSWQLHARSLLGWGTDYEEEKSLSYLQQYGLNAIWRSTPCTDWGLLLEWGNLNYFDPETVQSSLLFSLRQRHCRGGSLEAFGGMNWRNSDRSCEVQLFTDCEVHLGARWHYLFANGHRLLFDTQYFHSSWRHKNPCTQSIFNSSYSYKDLPNKRFEVLLTYTTPFDVPVAKRCDIGTLSGQIYDTFHHKPIPHALLNFGDCRFLTDEEGRFCLQGLEPGTYYLRTEMLPPGLLARTEEPREVSIEGGRETFLTLQVVPAAALSGIVLDTERRPLPGVRVFLKQLEQDELVSGITNREGSFAFPQLRPGKWKIHVAASVATNDQIVALSPESKEHLVFHFLPKEEREILWIEESLER